MGVPVVAQGIVAGKLKKIIILITCWFINDYP